MAPSNDSLLGSERAAAPANAPASLGSMADKAVEYAKLGWTVFPLAPGSKKPLPGSRGFKDATTDEVTIRGWWTKNPTANIGVATGEVSGITVLDVDVKNGAGGDESLASLEFDHGGLPETPWQRTWSGGRQYVFAHVPGIRNSAGKLGKGLDIRGEAGYIVVPPSTVGEPQVDIPPSAYTWHRGPFEIPPAPMPTWIIAKLRTASNGVGTTNGRRRSTNRFGWVDALIDGVPEGSRDDSCVRLIGRYTRMRPPLSKAEITRFILAWAETSLDAEGCPFPAKTVLEKVERLFKAMAHELVDHELTDAGNAERLVALHGDRIRWLPADRDAGDWLVWDGRRWAFGSVDRVRALALETARATQAAAVRMKSGERRGRNHRRAILNHALAAESAARIDATVKLARILPGVVIDRAKLDSHPFLLNVANGTIDLRTGELRPHDAADFLTQLIDIAYDPEAEASRWRQFLQEVFLKDAELIDYVQRAVGYTATGSIEEQVFFLLHGGGANGKSKFTEAVSRTLGDYAVKVAQETVLEPPKQADRGKATPELLELVGRRLAYIDELTEGRQLDEARIKSLTGSAQETGRALYRGQIHWRNTAKLWFDLNDLPRFKGVDEGIARRPRVIPFDRRFEDDEQDKRLGDKLWAERSGILAWIVEGARRWRERGLDAPEAVSVASREYVGDQNHLPAFFAETYVKDQRGRVAVADLRGTYEAWCEQRGVEAMRQEKVNVFLKTIWKLRQDTHGGGGRVWVGLARKAEGGGA